MHALWTSALVAILGLLFLGTATAIRPGMTNLTATPFVTFPKSTQGSIRFFYVEAMPTPKGSEPGWVLARASACSGLLATAAAPCDDIATCQLPVIGQYGYTVANFENNNRTQSPAQVLCPTSVCPSNVSYVFVVQALAPDSDLQVQLAYYGPSQNLTTFDQVSRFIVTGSGTTSAGIQTSYTFQGLSVCQGTVSQLLHGVCNSLDVNLNPLYTLCSTSTSAADGGNNVATSCGCLAASPTKLSGDGFQVNGADTVCFNVIGQDPTYGDSLYDVICQDGTSTGASTTNAHKHNNEIGEIVGGIVGGAIGLGVCLLCVCALALVVLQILRSSAPSADERQPLNRPDA